MLTSSEMDELSLYGDGVLSSTDRSNEYIERMNAWKEEAVKMPAGEALEQFKEIEKMLVSFQESILHSAIDIPESLQEIIKKHSEQQRTY